MKKIMILLFAFIIPITNVNAKMNDTFDNTLNTPNTYITKYTDYDLYIMDKEYLNKFKFENGILSIDPLFKKGGYLNLSEFKIIGGKDSYLFDGSNYWTMTSSNDNVYSIDEHTTEKYKLYSSTDISGARATQYIKKHVKVTGTGKYEDPWEFQKLNRINKVTIKISRSNGEYTVVTEDVLFEQDYEKMITVDEDRTTIGATIKCDKSSSKLEPSSDGAAALVTVREVVYPTECTIETQKRVHQVTVKPTNGTVKGTNPQTIEHGEDATFELSPSPGYRIEESTYTGCEPYTVNGSTLTLTNIKAKRECEIKYANGIYKVTFNANGGSVTTSSKQVTYLSTYGTLPTPTRSSCYSFAGWYTSTSGGTRITATSTVNITANQTLYARWTSVPDGGTWGSCYQERFFDGSAHGTEHNTCDAKRPCTVPCSYIGTRYSAETCGTIIKRYSCNGNIWEEADGYKECIQKPTWCVLTFSPSSVEYGSSVPIKVTGESDQDLTSVSFSGLKFPGSGSVDGKTFKLTSGTAGSWCDDGRSCSSCEWCGNIQVCATVRNSSGYATCCDSYYVYD